MRIEGLNSATSKRLIVIDVDAPLRVAAVSLSNPGIGLIVVRDGDGKAMGVLSKSDLIRHIIAGDPNGASVSALMSTDIVSCAPEDEVQAAWATMVSRR